MDAYLPWFTLKYVPGIGNHLYKRLIERFGSPEHVFTASKDRLLEVEGISARLITALRQAVLPAEAQKDLDLVAKKGYGIVCLTDPAYPPLLREIPDPPPFLYVSGILDPSAHLLAVVGSRNATPYGVTTTHRLCSDLAGKGMTIVSGMARGIDTAAHEGALMGKGLTIAVLGSGLEQIYPAENRHLFQRISENGAVISEFALSALPEAHHFPQRNRVISGMSLGTLVVEATRKSGSLITARLAAEQNREVFAIPGSIHSFKSAGTHILIKQGAKLVEHVQDILDELNIQSRTLLQDSAASDVKGPEILALPPLSETEAVVFSALSPYPVHSDDLVRRLSLTSGKLMAVLLQLEVKGLVQQTAGNYFSIKAEDRRLKKNV
jgi:DNA processing protein